MGSLDGFKKIELQPNKVFEYNRTNKAVPNDELVED